ncbi:coiled-coil domain-containing protein 171-like [Plakobranchus ocellatus]|uniref:Coiled-coil domain-containing protein 171-like n=1 Tax=Plakobranchus ocellatus TaxID=259542 RepID=A0AAV4DDC8_9GAST|nr:coiled-coil domain-containing protein 171-like [Plakobranchus ocellatus]
MEHNRNDNNQLETSYARLEKEMQSEGYLLGWDGNESITQYTHEINRLQTDIKQMRLELQTEQDVVLQLKRKLNNAEKQKLESAAKSNEEIASLETQLAKARSQVEKGEAVRQNLEYELTKSQREVEHVKQTWKDKETVLISGTEDLKGKISDLSDEVKRLQQSLKSCTTTAEDHENKLKENLETVSKKLRVTETELESSLLEQDKLGKLCQQHSQVISELNEKLQEFEEEKKNVLESLRRASAELQYAQEREDRLKSDYESARSRIKTLEENIEAERASHLETKFNSEIVQLRVRDLDGAVEVEKSANSEANKTIERLTLQNRELEQVYEEERKNRKDLSQKLDKMEKEYGSARRQLSKEVEEKKTVIGSLSKELEVHQKNFNELKSELSKAKKRQQYLEDTYGGSIKELEFLIQTFQFDDKKLRAARKEGNNSANTADKSKKVSNPSVVVESFKQMLLHVKRRLDAQSEELNKSKKAVDRLSKELDSSKEMIKAKDKTIEDTQSKYTKAAKDLNKSRANYSELESTIGKLKTSLQVNASNQDKDRTRIQELSEEIMKLVKRHRVEEEERIAFLHGLYQRLLSSHLSPPTRDRTFNQFAWSDLTDVVYEQVSCLVDLLQSSEEKMKVSSKANQDTEEMLRSLKQEHAEQITRLTNSSKEREVTWQQQKEQMEQHYNQMLAELQSRSTKTQTIADQAWEQVRATGNIQMGLEAEVVELRKNLAESQVQTSSLLSACALLSGALHQLQSRCSLLTSQRHILEDLYCTWENCRDRALYLNTVLNSGKDGDQDKPERDRKMYRKVNPLLTFRAGAIAVMAANRLSSLGQASMHCFDTYTAVTGDIGLSVCAGNLAEFHSHKILGEEEQSKSSSISDRYGELFAWLKSSDLLDTVVTSMTDLHEIIRQKTEPGSPGEARALLSAARSSFSKFIERLGQFFPAHAPSASSSIRNRSSLVSKLDKRLCKILNKTTPHMRGTRVSSQDLMSSLQNHILDLTQRLHTAEKERRHLLADLNEMKQQVGEEGSGGHESMDKNSEKGTKYVSMSKFERVCMELSSALRREQKAQLLLQEQSNQLMELTSRLDLCASDGMHKESDLVQVQEGLTETQNELRRKEQSLRQLGKQLNQVEYERDSLESNLKDAENALHTAARDKEILGQYIKNVENALEKAKKQFIILKEPTAKTSNVSLSRLLLDADLIPQDIGRAGPELISVQSLVGSFVDAQHQAVSKVKALEEEIVSHRDHIDTLKSELSKAVHREFNEQIEYATDGALSSFSEQDSPEMFIPLKVDPETSQDSPQHKSSSKGLHSPPIYQSKRSAFHSVKSSSHPSPQKSPRPK